VLIGIELFFHPQQREKLHYGILAATYAWHGKHHTAHIIKLRERLGWESLIA